MQTNENNKKIKVRYLDIDGVLARYLPGLSKIEREEKLRYMQEVFDEFKLGFPSKEEFEVVWKNHNIYIDFKLSTLFSRDTLSMILLYNTKIYLDGLVEEWNERNKENRFAWNYSATKVGSEYYYRIQCLNSMAKTYKYYDVKHQPEKELPIYMQPIVLSKEAVLAFNKLMNEKPCDTLCITSSWAKMDGMPFTIDMLKYQGVVFPEYMEIERLNYTDSDRGLSIAADILRREARDSYDIIDDDFCPTYVMFKDHVIKPHNGLTMEDVETYLNQEKEKVMVMKRGN